MAYKKYQEFYLETSRKQLKKLSDLLMLWENNPRKRSLMEKILMLIHSLKGSSATMGYKKTNNLFHALEDVVDSIYREDLRMNQTIIDNFFNILKSLEKNLQSIKRGREINFTKEIRNLKNILKKKQISLTGINRRDSNKKSSKFLATWRNPSTVNISVKKLNKLQNLLDDLLLTRSKVSILNKEGRGSETISACVGADKIINDLRREISKLSVLPLDSILSSLPYLVRTIAQEEGKQVVLNISDDNLTIDKSILDELNDIFVQLLRNSIVHGLQANKKGIIDLKISLINNLLNIEFKDNGRGIDYSGLLAKALEKKVITKRQAQKMTKKEIKELIFKPGISSLENITKESGRGIGLSLVAEKIKELKGKIEVSSSRNKGTTFIIELPLPLSIFRSLIFRLGPYVFGLQLTDIKKIISLKNIKDFSETKTYNYKGYKHKILQLKNKIGLEKMTVLAQHILLLNNKLCLPVAGKINEHEMVMKKLSEIFNKLTYLKGGAVNSSGEIVLILDINKL